MKNLIVFVLVLIGLWWAGSSAYEKYYIQSEKKPFWKGTDVVQVCKHPYYSSNDCYQLKVTLNDNKTAKIQFDNGGYKVTEDIICWFAAQWIKGDPRYVFCRSWDSDGQQWDFLPSWAHMPTSEEQMKRISLPID